MSIKKLIAVGIVSVAASALALDYCEVTGVTARQRYPWNGLVDITYTVAGDASSMNRPSVIMTAIDENTGLTYLATTFLSAPPVTEGVHTVTWNPIADGLRITSDRMKMEVLIQDDFPLYCLINISGGSSASSYPVTYMDSVPNGGWTTAHKTNYIVMRWCPPGTFMMQGDHKVTLTKSLYMGVFEITQGQYKNVMGSSAGYKNMTGPAYPVGASYANIRGSADYPSNKQVASSSFVGKLMTKSGLSGIDLPTEAQWEYACRAGTITELSSGKGLTESNCMEVAKCYTGSINTAVVGSYKPNPWGLYDMHGNVPELCLDYYDNWLGLSERTDPVGRTTKKSDYHGRVTRGCGWSYPSAGSEYLPECAACYSSCARGFAGNNGNAAGFRVCMTIK